eukprot:gnl/TRDRNA2_/TRDRNA2_208438_c0_seq1.p1 gnl/TRDRNA2_/TRDRNA2_208438_c0~~gnl/TRDRNA2_/TRDRNA2_208438_c0_seq1.p1  ORF type:complete len:304 (-),score=16.29 gnl/TRDRNA2_/TRDRNA2_208438_c0_seq1:169-1080(-)
MFGCTPNTPYGSARRAVSSGIAESSFIARDSDRIVACLDNLDRMIRDRMQAAKALCEECVSLQRDIRLLEPSGYLPHTQITTHDEVMDWYAKVTAVSSSTRRQTEGASSTPVRETERHLLSRPPDKEQMSTSDVSTQSMPVVESTETWGEAGPVPMGTEHIGNEASRHASIDPGRIQAGVDTRRTILLRNVPARLTGEQVLEFLKAKTRGTDVRIKSLHLPLHISNGRNKTYCFVELGKPSDVVELHRCCHGHVWPGFRAQKACQVVYAKRRITADEEQNCWVMPSQCEQANAKQKNKNHVSL